MPFQRIILEEVNCPRCNAIAQIRIEREVNGFTVTYVVCTKCKYKKFADLLTVEQIRNEKSIEILKNKLSMSRDEFYQSYLRGRIAALEKEMEKGV